MTEFLKNLRLRASRRAWDQLARDDPLWAVLSDPDEDSSRWDQAEFLATGETDVRDLFRHIETLGVSVRRGSALDFGCGAGRLSRALSSRFETVVGVDSSAPMIGFARRMHSERGNLRFEQITTRRLPTIQTGSFDFVYSRLVLQHIQVGLALEYISDFFRVLSAGGVAAFSAPAIDPRRLRTFRPALRAVRELMALKARMSVSAIPRRSVERTVAASSGRMIAVLDDEAPPGWPGFLYVAEKVGGSPRP
jgi:2-polyprenyl-3-methyl-5-hydroxy-6-metoxy-1,4-benzoquinol methylase